jgi:transposase InsO family protein
LIVRAPVALEHFQRVEDRFKMIAPLIEIGRLRKAERFPCSMPDGKEVRNWGEAEKWCSSQSKLSTKTIRREYEKFKKNGQGALLRKQRKDRGSAGFFPAHPKAAWLVAYLYLECKQSCRAAFEAMIRDADLIEVSSVDLPSYETVRKWLNSMPEALKVYAREGRKHYRERMAPYLKHGHVDVYANQVWVGDHGIHDVECANDCFDDVESGAPIRIRLSAMLDFRSRMVVGATWCWEGSSRAIAACMRRGISKFGPPEHLYVDNGRDYRKVARGARPGYLTGPSRSPDEWLKKELDSIEATGFCARLNIAVTHCIPHHPQSKCIERFFRTVHERFDKVWPTYTSGDPFTRPDSTGVAMVVHRRLLKAGHASQSKHPKASQFILACLAWIEEYNNTAHDGEGMEGATPRQVFYANLNPRQGPAPDAGILALLMADHEKRLVRECTVTLNKHRYEPVDQTGWAVMHGLNEHEVMVAHDPTAPEAAAAFDLDGNFLAWLECERLARFAPGDAAVQARIADSMATRRRLEKGTGEIVAAISKAARANGARTPLEAMAERLSLGAGETGADVVTQRNPRRSANESSYRTSVTPAEAARMLLRDSNCAPEPSGPVPGELTDKLTEILRRRDKTAKDDERFEDAPVCSRLEGCA